MQHGKAQRLAGQLRVDVAPGVIARGAGGHQRWRALGQAVQEELVAEGVYLIPPVNGTLSSLLPTLPTTRWRMCDDCIMNLRKRQATLALCLPGF